MKDRARRFGEIERDLGEKERNLLREIDEREREGILGKKEGEKPIERARSEIWGKKDTERKT